MQCCLAPLCPIHLEWAGDVLFLSNEGLYKNKGAHEMVKIIFLSKVIMNTYKKFKGKKFFQ